MNTQEQQQANTLFETLTSNASEKDIDHISKKINKMNQGQLSEIWSYILVLWDYICDPHELWVNKTVAIGSLLYMVTPFDAIPDLVPALGLTDDVAIILLSVTRIGSDLNKYYKK